MFEKILAFWICMWFPTWIFILAGIPDNYEFPMNGWELWLSLIIPIVMLKSYQLGKKEVPNEN